MKIIVALLAVGVAAQAQTPTPKPYKPLGSSLDKPAATPRAQPTPFVRQGPPKATPASTLFPGQPKPPAGPSLLQKPVAGQKTHLRGTVKLRTGDGVVVQSNNGLIWLTGIDLQAGAVVDVIAERNGTAECPPAFGTRPLNAYKLAPDQSR